MEPNDREQEVASGGGESAPPAAPAPSEPASTTPPDAAAPTPEAASTTPTEAAPTPSPAAAAPQAPLPEPETAAVPLPEPVTLAAPAAPDEAWGRNMGSWARRHPGLALLLLLLTFGAPFAMSAAQRHLVRASMTHALDEWQAQLEQRGLPIPFLPAASVPPPPALPRDPAALAPVGLSTRMELLLVWEALLSGRDLPPLPPAREPLPAALRACVELRAAAVASQSAAHLARAAEETAQSPPELRPALELCAHLLEGRAQEVAGAASERAERAAPAARAALLALVAEARHRRVLEVLAARPPGIRALEELIHAARTAPDTVATALAEEAPRLGELLEPGEGDLQRAGMLLDAFEALQAAQRVAFSGPAWEAAREGIAQVVAARLRRFDDDPQPALALAARLVTLDPQADVPRAALEGWRERLMAVVNDGPLLLRVAGTVLELGHLPPALEELLPGVEELQELPPNPTPGQLLGAALVSALPALGRDEAPPVDGLLESLARLERSLGGRSDPIARRVRAQAALLEGRARLAADDPAGARQALLRGLADHPARFRVLLSLARSRTALVAKGEGQPEELARAQEELEAARRDLDARADALGASHTDLPSELALELELAGRPTDQRALVRWRALLLQAAAAVHKAGGRAEEAVSTSRQAVELRPEDGELWLAHARLLLDLSRPQEASQAALQGIQARPGPRVTQALRELLNQLGPR